MVVTTGHICYEVFTEGGEREGEGRVGRGGARGLSGEEIKGKSTFR